MHEISLKTERKTQLIEITDLIRDALGGTNGATAALVYVPHTTAGVAINERIDPELVDRPRERVPARRGRRLGVAARRRDGPNAPSHARASLASSPQVLIPLRDGSLALGTTRASSSASSTGRASARSTSTTL